MAGELAVSQVEMVKQYGDAKLVEMWLHGRPETTQVAYAKDIADFINAVALPLQAITLPDLQKWVDTLAGATSTRGRKIASVKSLFTSLHRLGAIEYNVAAMLRAPKGKDRLAERILDVQAVQDIISAETNPRNRVLLRLFYASAAREEEICGLKWRDCVARAEGGQITVFGKGDKTRAIVLPQGIWNALMELRGEAADDAPVFVSRKGRGHLDASQVFRIVQNAARREKDGKRITTKKVSPHWLRHAHASHAIDAGAPITLVQQTLGHTNIRTTSRYVHARPGASSSSYINA